MNVNQALRRLKIMLSSQYKFAEAELVDGTEVYTEGALEIGAILFVRAGEGVSEDPFAPAGKHETTDGIIVTVGENGEITDITNTDVEEEPAAVEMEEVEVEVEVEEELVPATEELLNGIAQLIEPFTEEIAALQTEVIELKKKYEEMAALPGAPRIKNTFASVLADKNDATTKRLEALAKMRKRK
jgi:hypothetical protein